MAKDKLTHQGHLTSESGELFFPPKIVAAFEDARVLRLTCADYAAHQDLLNTRRDKSGAFVPLDEEFEGIFDPRTVISDSIVIVPYNTETMEIDRKPRKKHRFSEMIVKTSEFPLAHLTPVVNDKGIIENTAELREELRLALKRLNPNGGHLFVARQGRPSEEEVRNTKEAMVNLGLNVPKGAKKRNLFLDGGDGYLFRTAFPKKAERRGRTIRGTKMEAVVEKGQERVKRVCAIGDEWDIVDTSEADQIYENSKNIPTDARRLAEGEGATYRHRLTGTLVEVDKNGNEYVHRIVPAEEVADGLDDAVLSLPAFEGWPRKPRKLRAEPVNLSPSQIALYKEELGIKGNVVLPADNRHRNKIMEEKGLDLDRIGQGKIEPDRGYQVDGQLYIAVKELRPGIPSKKGTVTCRQVTVLVKVS